MDLEKFVKENVTGRSESLFAPDIKANADALSKAIAGKSILVIGGAGSIGSSFIKALLPFGPSKLVVLDLNENGLAELTRDLRSSAAVSMPEVYLPYTLDSPTRFSKISCTTTKASISLQISRPTSTCEAKKTNTQSKLCLKTMSSRPENSWSSFAAIHRSISSVYQPTRPQTP